MSRYTPWQMIIALRFLLPLVALGAVAYPVWVFFSVRGGFVFLSGLDAQTTSLALFPVVGLLAFSLLWVQLMIGSTRPWLERVFPKILGYHMWQGIFVFLFAVLHPLLRFAGYGPVAYFENTAIGVDPALSAWLLVGVFQLFLMVLTVAAGLLRRWTKLRRHWHTVHVFNYIVFALAWMHSWSLGAEPTSPQLRWVWIFFGVSALLATAFRFIPWRHRKPASESTPSSANPGDDERFRSVARVDQLQSGGALCVSVDGQDIALFRVDGSFYALANECSHSGGPLCEGMVDGLAVECPLHASRFDLRTGAVLSPPASEAQRTYPVRVRNGMVEIRV